MGKRACHLHYAREEKKREREGEKKKPMERKKKKEGKKARKGVFVRTHACGTASVVVVVVMVVGTFETAAFKNERRGTRLPWRGPSTRSVSGMQREGLRGPKKKKNRPEEREEEEEEEK